MICGARASSPRIWRSRLTRTSMLRSKGSASRPRSSSVSCARRQHPVGRAQQHREQPVLGAAQGDFLARAVGERARDRVQAPAVEGKPAHVIRARIAWRVGRAAQDRLDAPEQFARVEGLGDVVIGPEFQPDDAVHVLAARGEHDDRHLRVRPQLAAQCQPVLARQHQVEHDQIDMRALHDAAHLLAVGHRGGAELVLFQVLRQ